METRVLFLPLNFGEVVQSGIYDAFRQAGCNLEVFDYMMLFTRRKHSRAVREYFINRVKNFRPNLIHMQIQHTTVIDSRSVGVVKQENPNTIVVNWTGDVRNYVPQTYSRMATVSDYNLISSTGQIELFKSVTHKDIKYWQIGYNPHLYYPCSHTPQTFQYDISFIGNCSPRERYPGAPTRIDACKLLRGNFGMRFGLFGNGWPRDCKSSYSIDQRKVMDIYHNSLCCLSVSHYNDLNHYFSDRLLMCMASGRPTISLRFPGWDSYFTDMCDLIIVDNINQIPEKVEMLKRDPDLANYIGASGAAKVAAEHTYLSRIRELLNMVGLV